MLSRLGMLVLSLSIFITQAYAASGSGLKTALDEFTYTMQVEGAALNPAARKAAEATLKQNLRSLNLSNQQLIEAALAEVKDQKLATELRAGLAQIELQKLNGEEAAELLRSIVNQTYMNGASWTGRSDVLVIGAFLLVFLVLMMLPTGPGCSDPEYYAKHQVSCDNPPEHDWYYDNYDW